MAGPALFSFFLNAFGAWAFSKKHDMENEESYLGE